MVRTFLLAKNEAVVEEIVENHSDKSGKAENAGTFDEFVVKREMNGGGNVEGKFVNWSDKTEEPSEERADNEGGKEIPSKKHSYAVFGDRAFLPSDAGMKKIGEKSSSNIRDDAIEPEKIVVAKNAGKDGIDDEIEDGEGDTDNSVFADALGGGSCGEGFGGIFSGFGRKFR